MQSRQTKVDDINRTLGTYTKLNPFDNGSPSKITSNHIHPNRLKLNYHNRTNIISNRNSIRKATKKSTNRSKANKIKQPILVLPYMTNEDKIQFFDFDQHLMLENRTIVDKPNKRQRTQPVWVRLLDGKSSSSRQSIDEPKDYNEEEMQEKDEDENDANQKNDDEDKDQRTALSISQLFRNILHHSHQT